MRRQADGELDRLDERFLQHPALAVEQSRLTVNAMARTAKDNLLRALKLLKEFSEESYRKVEQTEDLVDRYEDKLGTYLVRLNTNELDQEQNEKVSKYLHTLSDFERISDHAMNIAETAREIQEKKIRFSGEAGRELEVLTGALTEILELAIGCFVDGDLERAYQVEPLEERIDVLCDEMKLRHVERLQTGECSLDQGFVFNDLLTNCERVADHCSNIAVAMIELEIGAFDTHGYIIDLKELHSQQFDELYEHYSEEVQHLRDKPKPSSGGENVLPGTLFAFLGGLQNGFDLGLDLVHGGGGLHALDDVALAVDQELGEVPLDVAVVLVVLVHLLDDAAEHQTHGAVEALKAGVLGQPLVEGDGVLAVDVDLGKLREGDAEAAGAEGVDLLVGAGGLIGKLVAGEVQDLQTVVLVGVVDLLQLLVLGGEAAAGGGVDDQQDLALVVGQRHILSLAGLDGEIINVHGTSSSR